MPKNINQQMKRCSKCGEIKSKDNFGKHARHKDGLQSHCKSCRSKSSKEYLEKNQKEISKRRKKYRAENHELILKQKKEYRLRNKEKIAEQDKKHYLINTEQILNRKKEYYKKNIERITKQKKEYYQNNKNKFSDNQKKYYQNNIEKFAKNNKEYRNQNKNKYRIYAHQLTSDEKPIKDENNFLLVKCTYCGRYYYPTNISLSNRIKSLKGISKGESRLYCSMFCKESCPVYNQKIWPKGYKKATSREVNPILRQLVLKRDNYQCQKCSKTIDNITLHVHHIKSYAQNKILGNDPDNCIVLCVDCHKEVHNQNDCRYHELRCNSKRNK